MWRKKDRETLDVEGFLWTKAKGTWTHRGWFVRPWSSALRGLIIRLSRSASVMDVVMIAIPAEMAGRVRRKHFKREGAVEKVRNGEMVEIQGRES